MADSNGKAANPIVFFDLTLGGKHYYYLNDDPLRCPSNTTELLHRGAFRTSQDGALRQCHTQDGRELPSILYRRDQERSR